MDALEYLKRIKKLEKIINNTILEVERWRSIATSMPSSIRNSDRVQTSTDKDKLGRAVVEYVALEESLTKEIINLEKERQAIIDDLKKLDSEYYDILYKLCVLNMSYYEVADVLEKSVSSIRKKRHDGLKQLQEILDKKKEL